MASIRDQPPAAGAAGSAEEQLVARPVAGPVVQVRSTLIQSSLHALRACQLGERYAKLLAPEFHDVVFHTLEPVWLPMSVAVAHYQACEALELSEQQQVDVGNVVSQHLQGTFLRTLARTGRNLGATPWTILINIERVWDRTFRGGGVALYKLGPKDARVELFGLSISTIPYFQTAYRGAFLMATSIFASRAYCTLLRTRCGRDRLCYKLSWA